MADFVGDVATFSGGFCGEFMGKFGLFCWGFCGEKGGPFVGFSGDFGPLNVVKCHLDRRHICLRFGRVTGANAGQALGRLQG